MSEQIDTLYWAAKIGGKLRARRQHLGLSLEDLSRLSGSTVPTLSHIERGKRDVKLSTLVSLAAALRVDLYALFDVDNDQGPKAESESNPTGYDLDEG